MKRRLLASLLLTSTAACSTAPPAAEPAPAPAAAPVVPPAPAAAAAEPSPEEKERKLAADKLAAERAEMLAEAEKERARFTPELRSAAQALAEKSYPTLQAAVKAALAGKHRVPGHEARDPQRHPLETLQFFGVTPKSTVLEYGPGEGWYTEILAPTLAKHGKLLATTADPRGPRDARPTFYAERFALFLEKSPELYGKVTSVVVQPEAPDLALTGTVDVALVIRGIHGMVNSGTLSPWLAEIHQALKKNGVLGIVQHRAVAGADPAASARNGYVPEAWLIAQVEAAGFKLGAKSEINANPKDTKDYEGGVWALPPSFKHGDRDREKYAAIGESDRMTLRFTRVGP